MPSTNFSRYARVAESTLGTTPASPAMQYAYLTAENMEATDAFARSEVITGDRGIIEHLRVGQQVAGSVTTELGLGWSDFFFELALFDRFAAGVEAFNVTADSNVTNVDSATQTILAAGAWLPGMVIDVSGLATAGNNKTFKAQAGTGAGSIIAPAGTFAATEAAPPARARVLYRGFEGAVGDLVTAADGITSTALDFTTMPIPADACIKIAGFDNAGVDVYAPVENVTANKITLRKLPPGWTAGLGAGKTVRIYVGEPIEPGADVIGETHEKWNTKSSPIAYEKFVGVAGNQLVIPLQQDSIVRPTLSQVAFYGGVSETAAGASYGDPVSGVTKRPMKTGNNVGRLVEGSTDYAAARCMNTAQITISNNLTPKKCLAHDAPKGWNEGDFEVIVEGAFEFADKTILEKYYNQTESGFFTVIQRDGSAFAIEVLAGVYTRAGAPNGGRNQDLVVNGRLEGMKHSTKNKTLVISRFRKFSNG